MYRKISFVILPDEVLHSKASNAVANSDQCYSCHNWGHIDLDRSLCGLSALHFLQLKYETVQFNVILTYGRRIGKLSFNTFFSVLLFLSEYILCAETILCPL